MGWLQGAGLRSTFDGECLLELMIDVVRDVILDIQGDGLSGWCVNLRRYPGLHRDVCSKVVHLNIFSEMVIPGGDCDDVRES